MEQKNPTFRLRTNALILFALFYAAAAITALLGLLDFDLWAFKDMLLAMEIVTPSVVQGSYVFFGVIALVMVLWPGVLAVCIAMALFKRSGFSLLSGIVDVCAKAVKILRYVFIGYFVFRVIRYTIVHERGFGCLPADGNVPV